LCDLLGIELPIVAAPMGASISGPELAAAVSNAGGLGIVSFGANPPPLLRRLVERVRELTDRPFGVNYLLPFTIPEQVDVCVEQRVPVLSTFWGDPAPYVGAAHDAGLKVLHQVGSVADARRAVDAGVDAVIAQGAEAGGHVAGGVATMVLVPRVVDAIAPVPVIAAGGIGDARGVVAALSLGAAGVALGTRFLATAEAAAHAVHKEQVVAATEEDTALTTMFGGGWPDAPHRALRTPFVAQWLGRGQQDDQPVIGESSFAGERIPVRRFWAVPPSADATGDVASMALLAGQAAGLVDRVEPAGGGDATCPLVVVVRVDDEVIEPRRGTQGEDVSGPERRGERHGHDHPPPTVEETVAQPGQCTGESPRAGNHTTFLPLTRS